MTLNSVFRKTQWLLTTLSFFFLACTPDEELVQIQDNGNASDAPDIYLSFDLGSTSYSLTDHNRLVQIFRPDLVQSGADLSQTGLSFRSPGWPLTDYIQFRLVLPIDSSSLVSFDSSPQFLINDEQVLFTYPAPYLNAGTILFAWQSSVGNLDETRQFDEFDTSIYFNQINSITYKGNNRYDTFENLFLCDFEITGEFKMRIENQSTGDVMILDNGEYAMIVDVVAQ